MKLLFEVDTKDYNIKGTMVNRPSVRSIIIKNNKLAMIHSLKYDYYKFPGGGIEPNESKIDTLIRETKEEAGLRIKLESIKEFGYVHRIQKGDYEDVFIQDNYYYFVDVYDEVSEQLLDDYEADECFTLEYIDPNVAVEHNSLSEYKKIDKIMLEINTKIVLLLVERGYLK